MTERPLAYSYVRMSSLDQVQGHGRRRQLQVAQELAEKYNLQLADERQLQDLGVSAYRGANVKEGALGKFLKAVTSGQVPKGRWFLLEGLDRFSRQKPLDSLYALFTIIRAGIIVATEENLKVPT